jgi:hypothetical protein
VLSLPEIVTWFALTAVTVRVDEPPDAMEPGLAVICTVGAGLAETVTVTVAEAVPPAPVAVAVYVVVLDGLTGCGPPLAARAYELPSEPVTVTWVASVAVTVNMDELPGAMAVGSAKIVTVGGGFAVTVTVAVAVTDPPAPVAVAV